MDTNEIKVFLGNSSSNGKEIYWNPKNERNPHVLVVGTSGSGKTETIKSIALDLMRQKIPMIFLDFHEDFLEFGENIIDLNEHGFNPLQISGSKTPKEFSYQLADILSKVYELGEIQEALIRKSIQEAYQDTGFNLDDKTTYQATFPTFSNVAKMLEQNEEKEAKRARMRCSDLFDLRVFNTGSVEIPFEKLMTGRTVLSLKNLPTETVKMAVAEFFLNKLFYELYAQGKTNQMKGFVFIDEAHRLTYEGSPVDVFLRESRKYGWGVILSSQRPSDFSETTLANVGTFITLQCSLEKDAKFIAKQVGVDWAQVKQLNEAGKGFAWFGSTLRAIPVKIKPLSEKASEKEKQEFNKSIEKRRTALLSEYVEITEKARHWEKRSTQLTEKLDKIKKDYENKITELDELKHEVSGIKNNEQTLEEKIQQLEAENVEKEKIIQKLTRKVVQPAIPVLPVCSRGHENRTNAVFCRTCGVKI